MRSIGIRPEALRALFFPKNGLGFHHVDESVRDLARAPEYVLETFDETFQVERRVLDSLLLAQSQRLGVEVVQGARVNFARSHLGAGGNAIEYSVGPQRYRLGSRLLVDASGPAGVLSRHLGLRTTEGLPFQTSAVWAYFTGIRKLATYSGWPGRSQFPRDQYTQHLCFREGWLWYIPLVSWQAAPTANLGRALERLLGAEPPPSREQLVSGFGCPVEDVVSVGVTLRSDRDGRIKDDARGAFAHFAKKYPAIGQLLDGARLLDDHYGTGQPFMSRLQFRGHARRVAGDGWLLVGDAAFFVDPLVSPGLTGGVAGAYRAVEASERALDAGVFSVASFAGYETFVHELHEALERDNQLVYMSFNHPAALALIQRFQEIDARRHFLDNRGSGYGPADTNVWGILDPAYQEMQKAAWRVLRDAEEAVGRTVPIEEQSIRDYEPMVAHLRTLLGGYLEEHADLTPYARANAAA
jgi:flavin-dependent dehydrogenase